VLAGQAGLVTGGTSGIGAAITARLAHDGAHVVSCGRRPPDAPPPRGCFFVPADVRRYDQAAAVCAVTRERCGRLDFVVASAGTALQGTVADGDPAEWRRVVETNVLGTANVLHAAARALREQGEGDLVLIASVAGRGTHAGEPVYLASKWAVVGLGHALRRELRPHGVRVTLVEPGLVDTPLTRAAPRVAEWLAAVDPLRPDDVADVVAGALARPRRVSVNEITLRPSDQEV